MTNTTNTTNVTNSVTFARELDYIKNERLRNFTGYVLDKLPDYFRHIGASSSEKYHSKQCLGEGGLMRHTKFAIAVASHMDKWTTSKYSDTVLPRPKTDIQKCVHLCDYIASRKHLIFDFDVYDHEMDELDGGVK